MCIIGWLLKSAFIASLSESSNLTLRSYSIARNKLLPWLLSHDILMIFLWNVILCRRIAPWNDNKASFKPGADVSMRGGTISCATGVDLCERCCNTLNYVRSNHAYITHSRVLPWIRWGMYENCRICPWTNNSDMSHMRRPFFSPVCAFGSRVLGRTGGC